MVPRIRRNNRREQAVMQPTNHPAGTAKDDGPLFVLVAGEASGDLLGADLIAGLRARYPAARFAGVGGPRMQAAGMHIWYPAERLAVMGLVEVLRHLPQLLALRRDVYARTLQDRPAVFIGIDAPDFNLGLERKLKRAGVRTAHYVSPSVWAWRENRAEKIGRSIFDKGFGIDGAGEMRVKVSALGHAGEEGGEFEWALFRGSAGTYEVRGHTFSTHAWLAKNRDYTH